MKTIKDLNVNNKTIILRCDYNVPIENNEIKDNSRISKSIETINYLYDKNCKIIILSHLGKIKTSDDLKNNSLKIVAKELCNIIKKNVYFINTCEGIELKNKIDEINKPAIILLENTRSMDLDNKKESNNDVYLSKYWASLGDIFINDAFGSCHRAHASTAGIARFIPSAIGFLVEEELNKLNPLIDITQRPFTIFMGGAKIEDKLPIIKSLINCCDYLILGGGIANSFLKAMGMDVKNSLCTTNEVLLNEIRVLYEQNKEKIVLPIDFVWNDNAIMDVGNNSIIMYTKYLYKSKIIFMNGTPGKFEDDGFAKGTKSLFGILHNVNCKVILGGGDTLNAAKKFNYEKDFYFQSSGGGATLEYIADQKLEALEWQNQNI